MISGFLRTMRPHQWMKNLFVLGPLIFALELFDVPALLRSLAAFAIFCLLASAVYVLNDLVDVEADRRHPVKKNRPIASGKVSIAQAKVGFAVLIGLTIAGSLPLGLPFLAVALGYLLLNVAYSFGLKKVAYLDVLCVAAGFELRVLAGALAAQVPASAYLLIETLVLATFLAFGKRAHELAVMELRAQDGGPARSGTRAVLDSYDARTLTVLLYATGAASVITYGVYTLDPHTIHAFGTRWLVVTTVFLLFGVIRFGYLARRARDAESPTDAMLRDRPFVANMVLSSVAVLAILYFT